MHNPPADAEVPALMQKSPSVETSAKLVEWACQP